jgi:hypothetical protein
MEGMLGVSRISRLLADFSPFPPGLPPPATCV